jgi:hypothetical protein
VPRRDELTYDVAERRRFVGGPSPSLLVLLVVVVVLAVVLVGWTVRSGGGSGRDRADAVPRVVASPATPRPLPSPTPTPSNGAGSDATSAERPPGGSENAVSRFVAAWLEQRPKARKGKLERTAAPGLASQLLLTAPENIPDAEPAGEPVLEDASPYSAQFLQDLDDGSRIRIFLVSDPQARFGWLATSVEQA